MIALLFFAIELDDDDEFEMCVCAVISTGQRSCPEWEDGLDRLGRGRFGSGSNSELVTDSELITDSEAESSSSFLSGDDTRSDLCSASVPGSGA